MDYTDSTGTIDIKLILWCPIMPENLWFPAGPIISVVPNGTEQTIQALLYTMNTTDTTGTTDITGLLVPKAAHIAYLGTDNVGNFWHPMVLEESVVPIMSVV